MELNWENCRGPGALAPLLLDQRVWSLPVTVSVYFFVSCAKRVLSLLALLLFFSDVFGCVL